MLDINFVRKNPDLIRNEIKNRNLKFDIEELLDLDEKRNGILQETEKMRAEKNKASKEIAKLSGSEKKKAIAEIKIIDKKQDGVELKLKELTHKLNGLTLKLPNISRSDVKVGRDETENEIIKKWGEPTKFDFKPIDYMEIGEKSDLIDIKRAGKVSGTRFGYLKREAVFLEFALIQFAFAQLIKEGFIPVIPPQMIGEKAMRGMGYFDWGLDEIYKVEKDNLYLIGTSEQAIGPMHMNEIFEKKDLPRRYVGFSTCFRREAGSHGKDTKGILRVHQFDKVEMFSFTKPEDSDKEHEFLLALEEKLYQALKLPYQLVKMCTGDLGIPAARKYDIEAWMPSQNRYREVTSTSTCTDFQSRRLNIRFRDKDRKLKFVHTLNGTAFTQRPIIAILENYQQKDGSVKVPEVLQKYCGFKVIGQSQN
jgi:seryl-tRNA synthetase